MTTRRRTQDSDRSVASHVVCRRCGTRLSSRVVPVDPAQLDPHAMGRQPTIAPALVARDPRPVTVWVSGPRDPTPRPRDDSPPGALVVHPDSTRSLSSSGRDSGCCGSDGCDGPNRSCQRCDAVVGTMRTDCWTAHEMRFLASAVELV